MTATQVSRWIVMVLPEETPHDPWSYESRQVTEWPHLFGPFPDEAAATEYANWALRTGAFTAAGFGVRPRVEVTDIVRAEPLRETHDRSGWTPAAEWTPCVLGATK